MRVISGKYKGRKLKGFEIEGTRPTMDRIKESLFGMIQDEVRDSVCLDLFAGSGALGIEALSNGAKYCDFIDYNNKAINIIGENTLNIDEDFRIVNSDYEKYLKGTDKKYDIIFLDPPYDSNLINKALKLILAGDLLSDRGIIICEYENEDIVTDLKIIKEKNYGLKNIKIFKK